MHLVKYYNTPVSCNFEPSSCCLPQGNYPLSERRIVVLKEDIDSVVLGFEQYPNASWLKKIFCCLCCYSTNTESVIDLYKNYLKGPIALEEIYRVARVNLDTLQGPLLRKHVTALDAAKTRLIGEKAQARERLQEAKRQEAIKSQYDGLCLEFFCHYQKQLAHAAGRTLDLQGLTPKNQIENFDHERKVRLKEELKHFQIFDADKPLSIAQIDAIVEEVAKLPLVQNALEAAATLVAKLKYKVMLPRLAHGTSLDPRADTPRYLALPPQSPHA